MEKRVGEEKDEKSRRRDRERRVPPFKKAAGSWDTGS
jgi:hypothetical protein